MKNKHRLAIILLFLLIVDSFVFFGERKGITGFAPGTQATATISLTIVSACSIPLKNGWNLVSFCANLTNKSIESNLKDINNSYRYILEWNASEQRFEVYSPLSSEKPFTSFNENKSYFIYFLESEHELGVVGELYNDANISLPFGWDTPIYPYEFTANITKYLSTIEGNFRYLMKWNATSQKFMIYSPIASEKPFEFIYMGEGQFLYTNNTAGTALFYNRSLLQ